MKTISLKCAAAVAVAMITSYSSHADTFNGNGNSGFGGTLGGGSLTVTDDGSGGIDFSLTTTGALGNDVVIFLDNGTGGGLSTTASLTPSDPNDGGQMAVSGLANAGNGGGRSTLGFGNPTSILAPQYALDFGSGYGDIFQVSSGTLSFVDGNNPNAGPSGIGANYTVSGNTYTLDLPSVDFGLSSYSGATLKFFATLISESGYRSNEAVGTLDSTAQGWGNTVNVTSANSFTAATAAPEPSSMAMMLGASVLGSLFMLRRKRA